jgi:hypothetical protein
VTNPAQPGDPIHQIIRSEHGSHGLELLREHFQVLAFPQLARFWADDHKHYHLAELRPKRRVLDFDAHPTRKEVRQADWDLHQLEKAELLNVKTPLLLWPPPSSLLNRWWWVDDRRDITSVWNAVTRIPYEPSVRDFMACQESNVSRSGRSEAGTKLRNHC